MADDKDDSIKPAAGVAKQPWETPRVTSAAVKETTDYGTDDKGVVPGKS
jgi:hypothetical protein